MNKIIKRCCRNKFLAFQFVCIYFLLSLVTNCVSDPGKAKIQSGGEPTIFPEYKNVTIPANIAPLNFRIQSNDKLKASKAEFYAKGDKLLTIVGEDGLIDIPEKKWQKLINSTKGSAVKVVVSVWSDNYLDGIEYGGFNFYVSCDSIDPWISYRLIEPGYEGWNKMGIYQRNLSNFDECKIVENDINNQGCVNCHSYNNYEADSLMFHARGEGGGTLICIDGEVEKVDLKKLGPKMQGVYPKWHPEGRYIVFSSNATHQSFYDNVKHPIEVFDSGSDLILYDIKDKKIITDPRFLTTERWETFPTWSADGRYLYFCAADSVSVPSRVEDLHYDLMRVGFDPMTGKFDNKIDTIISSHRGVSSYSYPRESPDGKYVMLTKSNYGTFPIWHDEADLELVRMADKKAINADALNSWRAESYHSWSSNGRWVIFSSRRLDGRYTRLYMAHIDADGNIRRPFLLPQKDPELNLLRLKSYNIPEFMKAKVMLNQEKLKELF